MLLHLLLPFALSLWATSGAACPGMAPSAVLDSEASSQPAADADSPHGPNHHEHDPDAAAHSHPPAADPGQEHAGCRHCLDGEPVAADGNHAACLALDGSALGTAQGVLKDVKLPAALPVVAAPHVPLRRSNGHERDGPSIASHVAVHLRHCVFLI